MKQTKRVFGMMVALYLTTGIAAAQDPRPKPAQPPSQPGQTQNERGRDGQLMAEKITLTATVDKVDPKNHTVHIKNDQGNQTKIEVPESVGDLSKIKKGDKVEVEYFQSLALKLEKPSKEKPSAGETKVAARSPAPLPGGVVARQVQATVEVVKIDKQNRQVTIKGPMGQMDTIHVDASMEQDLGKLKKGDRIEAAYTEAIAINVMPKSQEKQSRTSPQ
jgi:hypothetical protein